MSWKGALIGYCCDFPCHDTLKQPSEEGVIMPSFQLRKLERMEQFINPMVGGRITMNKVYLRWYHWYVLKWSRLWPLRMKISVQEIKRYWITMHHICQYHCAWGSKSILWLYYLTTIWVILTCLLLCWTKALTDNSSKPSSTALPTSWDSKSRHDSVLGFAASLTFSLEYYQTLNLKMLSTQTETHILLLQAIMLTEMLPPSSEMTTLGNDQIL